MSDQSRVAGGPQQVSPRPRSESRRGEPYLASGGSGSSQDEMRPHAPGNSHGGSGRSYQLIGAHKPLRPHRRARPAAPPSPPAPWNMVLEAISELRGEVNKLKEDRQPAPRVAPVVNEGAGTSRDACRPLSPPPGSFSGFMDSGSEDGEIRVFAPGSSALMLGAKSFGPQELVSEDIDTQVADMVNYVFDNGMREEDYKDTVRTTL
ncbi:uncharacterized protein LOC126997304 [Eriocheir sinensis]|uniref:uncharacterized protein LOC126997304 n=1 Tax=Eriocheir sinensis TaxID=95602 RepID=UPI0021C57811|nr:uncharacterized protein LOC126997304 [Eriocheir sinensis]